MKKLAGFSVAVSAMWLILAGTAFAAAQVSDGEEIDPSAEWASKALAEDLAITAKTQGWTFDEAAELNRTARRLDRLQELIESARPGELIGVKSASAPGMASSLYLKNKADGLILDAVNTAGIPITVIDQQPFSIDDLRARRHKVNQRLSAMGFAEVSTQFDLGGKGRISATVRRDAGAPEAISKARASEVSANLLTATGIPVDVRIIDGGEPLISGNTAHGGMWTGTQDGYHVCTSGWSVINENSTSGIAEAGHCSNVYKIKGYNSNISIVYYDLTHVREHIGTWGDVEWKTSGTSEPDNFWPGDPTSGKGELRDVAAVQARGNIDAGDTVCFYGTTSNHRYCRTVTDPDLEFTDGAGHNIETAVMTKGNSESAAGDSGGGVSNGNTAIGIYYGYRNVLGSKQDIFSVADLLDEALGQKLKVKTSP